MAASSSQMLPSLPRFKHADLVSGSRQARKSLAGVACAPCDDPAGLATGSGSAGITIAESASAAATIAADFIEIQFCRGRHLAASTFVSLAPLIFGRCTPRPPLRADPSALR